MNRRSFLKACVHAGSLGALANRHRTGDDSFDVRLWVTKDAARYGVASRAKEYVELAFGTVRDDLTVSLGGTVSVDREHGYRVMRSGEWPGLLAEGAAGGSDVDPVDDVNVLLTDGPMDTAPTGVGAAHVAAVGGARYLAALPRVAETAPVVPYSEPARVMQVLLHECGHAVGLSHDDGSVYTRGDAAIATPMISSYAWSEGYDPGSGACGAVGDLDAEHRRLSFLFSDCAAEAIADYDGELGVQTPFERHRGE
ncbi:peptidase M10A and M12B matrixin and adamalysin [Halostella sp. JP-L12]|uniref:peptidase M10A and M12B matrixin and adamalysin n=1 Tax=Halostella TaxID=1843185 RepID=UPI000EF805BF|nr:MULTISPECIES: peptidase M10A and M12B matrixin and adamalysin [Halostella]NHN47358.1 peptidase M10A and M12B matrixin and adamalysin [Halostella sp. JP-L12]